MSTTIDNETETLVDGEAIEDATLTIRGHEQISATFYACLYHRRAARAYGLENLERELGEIGDACKNRLGKWPESETELTIDEPEKLLALFEAFEYVVEGSLPGALTGADQVTLEPIYHAIGDLGVWGSSETEEGE